MLPRRRRWHSATAQIPHEWKEDGVDVVVDTPDGKSHAVKAIRYEEDLAGAIVIEVDEGTAL